MGSLTLLRVDWMYILSALKLNLNTYLLFFFWVFFLVIFWMTLLSLREEGRRMSCSTVVIKRKFPHFHGWQPGQLKKKKLPSHVFFFIFFFNVVCYLMLEFSQVSRYGCHSQHSSTWLRLAYSRRTNGEPLIFLLRSMVICILSIFFLVFWKFI